MSCCSTTSIFELDLRIVSKSVVPDRGNPTKNIGENSIKAILNERKRNGKFTSFSDLLKRISNNILNKTFSEVSNYQEFVLLKNITFRSHCEHHMAPIIGSASVAYIPDNCVVGISKLARVVDMFAKRLQTQETMTAQIANTIQSTLKPKGVAVLVSAEHSCMSSRGVNIKDTNLVTSHFTGDFSLIPSLKENFLVNVKRF